MERTIRRNTRFEILTPAGWSDFDGISKQITHRLIQIHCGNESLKCSYDHLILTEYGLKKANIIQVGDKIFNTLKELVTVDFIMLSEGDFEVYDPLEVKFDHQFNSGSFISHNCSFIGSSGTLIMGWKLEMLKNGIKSPINEINKLKIYEQPIKDSHLIDSSGKRIVPHKYVLVADVSRGKGLDYSAFSVIDVSAIPYRQVATYRNNEITPTDYTEIIYKTAQFYNECQILTEINDIGEQVGTMLLDDYEYEHVLCSEGSGRGGKRLCYNNMKADKGIRTTTPLKMSGCLLLKLLLEQNKLELVNDDTINEMLVFVKDKNTYKAEKGYHDDLAMTLVIFSWLTDQQYFKENYELNTMMSMVEKEDDWESDLTPLGYTQERQHGLFQAFARDVNTNLPFSPFREYEVWEAGYSESQPVIIENCNEAYEFLLGHNYQQSLSPIIADPQYRK